MKKRGRGGEEGGGMRGGRNLIFLNHAHEQRFLHALDRFFFQGQRLTQPLRVFPVTNTHTHTHTHTHTPHIRGVYYRCLYLYLGFYIYI
jgi:hypothetical protein